MIDRQILVHWIRVDQCAEEIIRIRPVEQCRKISRALFQGGRRQKALQAGGARALGRRLRNPLARLRASNQPINAGTRKRRVNPGSIECDGITRSNWSGLNANARSPPLNAFCNASQLTGINIKAKPRSRYRRSLSNITKSPFD